MRAADSGDKSLFEGGKPVFFMKKVDIFLYNR